VGEHEYGREEAAAREEAVLGLCLNLATNDDFAASTMSGARGLVAEVVLRADAERSWGYPEVALALLRALLANCPATLAPLVSAPDALATLLKAVKKGSVDQVCGLDCLLYGVDCLISGLDCLMTLALTFLYIRARHPRHAPQSC